MNFMLRGNLPIFTFNNNCFYRINTNGIIDHTEKGIVTVGSESQ